MIKKALFMVYAPIVLFILFVASLVLVFTGNYATLKAEAKSMVFNVANLSIHEKFDVSQINMEQIQEVCESNVTPPEELSFVENVCPGVLAGNYTTVDEVLNASVNYGVEQYIKPVNDSVTKLIQVAPPLYIFVGLLYILYLALLFFARKEGYLFYIVVAVVYLLILSFLVNTILEGFTRSLTTQISSQLPPDFKAPLLQIISDFKKNILPKVTGDAFNLTAALFLAPPFIGGAINFTLSFFKGKKKKK